MKTRKSFNPIGIQNKNEDFFANEPEYYQTANILIATFLQTYLGEKPKLLARDDNFIIYIFQYSTNIIKALTQYENGVGISAKLFIDNYYVLLKDSKRFKTLNRMQKTSPIKKVCPLCEQQISHFIDKS